MTEQLILIDLEASGLHEGSYPTEVAWCSHDLRRGTSYLVRPTVEWLAGPWCPAAEKVTGISQVMLGGYGLPPDQVAALNAEICGTNPLTDHPWGDGRWLRRLYDAAGIEPAFGICPPPPASAGLTEQITWNAAKSLFDIDVLTARIGNEGGLPWPAVEVESARLRQAAGLVEHRALDDAIGHALELGLVTVWTESQDPARREAALFDLVQRAKTLSVDVPRPGR